MRQTIHFSAWSEFNTKEICQISEKKNAENAPTKILDIGQLKISGIQPIIILRVRNLLRRPIIELKM